MHAALVGVLLGVSAWAQEPLPEATASKPAPPPRRAESILGARTLERGHFLYGLDAGLSVGGGPLMTLMPTAAVGLGGGFDLCARAAATVPPWPDEQSYQALDVSLRHALPWTLGALSFALRLDAIGAHFDAGERAENLAGPRHQTGLRDLDVGLGAPISFGNGMHLFLEPELYWTFDLAPASPGPLTGAPPSFTAAPLFGVELGHELVISSLWKGVRVHASVRMLFHTRPDDPFFTFSSLAGVTFG